MVQERQYNRISSPQSDSGEATSVNLTGSVNSNGSVNVSGSDSTRLSGFDREGLSSAQQLDQEFGPRCLRQPPEIPHACSTLSAEQLRDLRTQLQVILQDCHGRQKADLRPFVEVAERVLGDSLDLSDLKPSKVSIEDLERAVMQIVHPVFLAHSHILTVDSLGRQQTSLFHAKINTESWRWISVGSTSGLWTGEGTVLYSDDPFKVGHEISPIMVVDRDLSSTLKAGWLSNILGRGTGNNVFLDELALQLQNDRVHHRDFANSFAFTSYAHRYFELAKLKVLGDPLHVRQSLVDVFEFTRSVRVPEGSPSTQASVDHIEYLDPDIQSLLLFRYAGYLKGIISELEYHLTNGDERLAYWSFLEFMGSAVFRLDTLELSNFPGITEDTIGESVLLTKRLQTLGGGSQRDILAMVQDGTRFPAERCLEFLYRRYDLDFGTSSLAGPSVVSSKSDPPIQVDQKNFEVSRNDREVNPVVSEDDWRNASLCPHQIFEEGLERTQVNPHRDRKKSIRRSYRIAEEEHKKTMARLGDRLKKLYTALELIFERNEQLGVIFDSNETRLTTKVDRWITEGLVRRLAFAITPSSVKLLDPQEIEASVNTIAERLMGEIARKSEEGKAIDKDVENRRVAIISTIRSGFESAAVVFDLIERTQGKISQELRTLQRLMERFLDLPYYSDSRFLATLSQIYEKEYVFVRNVRALDVALSLVDDDLFRAAVSSQLLSEVGERLDGLIAGLEKMRVNFHRGRLSQLQSDLLRAQFGMIDLFGPRDVSLEMLEETLRKNSAETVAAAMDTLASSGLVDAAFVEHVTAALCAESFSDQVMEVPVAEISKDVPLAEEESEEDQLLLQMELEEVLGDPIVASRIVDRISVAHYDRVLVKLDEICGQLGLGRRIVAVNPELLLASEKELHHYFFLLDKVNKKSLPFRLAQPELSLLDHPENFAFVSQIEEVLQMLE